MAAPADIAVAGGPRAVRRRGLQPKKWGRWSVPLARAVRRRDFAYLDAFIEGVEFGLLKSLRTGSRALGQLRRRARDAGDLRWRRYE